MSVHDLSNHDWPTFDAACLKTQGMERGILGCWVLDITASMLLKLRAQSVAVEDLYTFVYYGLGWEQNEVNNALAVAKAQGGIRRIWIDCEATFTAQTGDLDTESADMTVARRIAITKSVAERIRVAGIEPCIYTGRYWWESNMGNTTEFSDLKLWVADYGFNDPKFPRLPIRTVAFGGWTATAAHQYTSRFNICGRERDANYWFIPTEEEMDPRVDDILKVLGTTDMAAWIAQGNVSLLQAFKAEQAARGEATNAINALKDYVLNLPAGSTDYESIGMALEKAGATIRTKGHGR